jgi:hypothetical protein
MTAGGDSHCMRWLVVGLAALCLSGSAGAAAVPPFPRLPGTWSHAEINVTLNKKPHTLSLDRGRITKVSGTQLTLREKTGGVVTSVPVPLSASAIVTIDGVRSTIYSLRPKMEAQTMRIDGGVAVRVRATT